MVTITTVGPNTNDNTSTTINTQPPLLSMLVVSVITLVIQG